MPNLFIIKDIAESKNITVKSVAEKAGITEAGLHGAIKKGDIKFSYLDKIANFLKVDLSVFSDFSEEKKKEGSISVGGSNLGNIAGGNLVQVSLPESGHQKIINPDGTTIIEPISTNKDRESKVLSSQKEQDLLDTIDLQKQLIQSLQDQVAMYKKKYES